STDLSPGYNPDVAAAVQSAHEQFEAGLDDDLNTAQALAAMFELIRLANIALSENRIHEDDRTGILKFFSLVDHRLAIVRVMETAVLDEDVEALIGRRNEARKNRDFALSDRIRQQLLDMGIVIEDTKEGTRWRRK